MEVGALAAMVGMAEANSFDDRCEVGFVRLPVLGVVLAAGKVI